MVQSSNIDGDLRTFHGGKALAETQKLKALVKNWICFINAHSLTHSTAMDTALREAVTFAKWTKSAKTGAPLEVRIGYSSGAYYELVDGGDGWLCGIWRTSEDAPLPSLVRGCPWKDNQYPRSVMWSSQEQWEEWGRVDLLKHCGKIQYIAMTSAEWHIWSRQRSPLTSGSAPTTQRPVNEMKSCCSMLARCSMLRSHLPRRATAGDGGRRRRGQRLCSAFALVGIWRPYSDTMLHARTRFTDAPTSNMTDGHGRPFSDMTDGACFRT